MKAVKINAADNVAVALSDIAKGETICVGEASVTLLEPVPAGHKFSLSGIKKGENIIKYGFSIGFAVCDISAGEHVHSSKLSSGLGEILEYEYRPVFCETPALPPETFNGYRRANGTVGIRNEVWIIPTVGCVNNIACSIEQMAQKYKNEHIDGIYAFNHPYGCSQLGDDQNLTLDFLCGLIRHPNAGAVLVMGLGCENGNIGELKKRLGDYDECRVKFVVCQDEEDEIEAALCKLKELCEYAATARREPCHTSELVIGLKCGGSDGFSGITANPLLGLITDRVTSEGGSAVLTEVPEMFGAETVLMGRCRTPEVFDKTVSLINNFKRYFMKYGERIDENPSPGNKAGGITTLAEKSLGCIQKGGTAIVEDVLQYGEPVKHKGLSLLQAPGNDLVASCALAASGAQLILFTTGRGTPFGCPVPTVKISSNTALYKRKKNWIDFNAGVLLENTGYTETADAFYSYILSVASGETRAKSEILDKHSLAVFKDGVTL